MINSILRNSPVFLQIAQLISLVVPLVTVPYYLKLYTLESFGQISFLILVAGILNVFVDFGQNQYGIVEVSRTEFNDQIYASRRVIGMQVVITVILLSIISLVMWDYKIILVLTSLFLGGLFPSWYFLGLKRQNELAIYRLLYSISFIVCILIFLHIDKYFYVYSLGIANFLVLSTAIYRERLLPIFLNILNYSKQFFVNRMPFVFNRITKNAYGQGYLFASQVVLSGESFGALIIYDKIITVYRRLLQPLVQIGMAEVKNTPQLWSSVVRFLWFPIASMMTLLIFGDTLILIISSGQVNFDIGIRLIFAVLFGLLYLNSFVGEIYHIVSNSLRIFVKYMMVYSILIISLMLLLVTSERAIFNVLIFGELCSLFYFLLILTTNVKSNS